MKFKNLKSAKISEAIASQMLGRIEDGSLKPGDKLPTESELISSFGVSRTALREGMQRLLMINAVEIRPGSGTFIRDIKKENLLKIPGLKVIRNKKRLFEIVELRKIVEIGIVELAIERADDSDIKKMGECVKSHEEGTIHKNFPVEGDTQFHKAIALATHNHVVINFYDDIFSLILNSIIQFRDYKSEYKKSLEFHKNILKAFKERDKDAATKAMRDHLDWISEIIKK